MCNIAFHQTLTWMMLDYERRPNCKHISMKIMYSHIYHPFTIPCINQNIYVDCEIEKNVKL
jgi:hypothetical protein